MSAVRGIIVAVSANGVIGLDGGIPWRHRGDQRRFKEVTRGATVIMGRHTWESLPRKPLPKRRNIIVTSRDMTDITDDSDAGDVVYVPSIDAALSACSPHEPVWFIGGARIYAEAMAHCNVIDVTHVPDVIDDPEAVRFPDIPDGEWAEVEQVIHEYNDELRRTVYHRRTAPHDPLHG